MIFREFGNPACLSSVQLLGFPEILEVLMICPDFKIFFGPHKVVAPLQ